MSPTWFWRERCGASRSWRCALALGASTAALRRSLLAESLVLCVSGVLAALLLAWPMVAVLGRYAARFSVRADGLALDFNLVWFGIALALVAAVFLALIPRLPAGDAPLGAALTGGGGSVRVTGGSSRRLRIFAVMQITASFLLLTGAAVLMRTLYTLEQTRPPFDTTHVLAVNLPVMTYGRTPQQVQDFYHEVQRRVSTLPGVARVSTGFSVPWRDDQGLGISFTFAAQGETRKNGLDDWRAKFRSVSPGYFETLGVPMVQGRDFRDSDKERRGARGDCEPEPGAEAVSRAAGAEPRVAVDRWRDEVYRHQPGAAADCRSGARSG